VLGVVPPDSQRVATEESQARREDGVTGPGMSKHAREDGAACTAETSGS
jgi:hypothetical protein